MTVAAYVAGRTSDVERVRETQRACRDCGLEITYDWTQEIAAGEAGPQAREMAEADLDGVERCDIFILLWRHQSVSDARVPIGKLIECGAAIQAGTRVVIVGSPPPSVFWELDQVTTVPNLEGLRHLLHGLRSAA